MKTDAGIMLAQQDGLIVESHARTYHIDGQFSEPYLVATFVNMDKLNAATFPLLVLDGPVPLLPRMPISFDCKTGGQNMTNIEIQMNGTTGGVVVYWTKYTNFVWNP